MSNRVRVRRDRPSALSWAFALALTMLAVYLITLSAPSSDGGEASASSGRVTREIELAGVEAYFAALGRYGGPTEARIAAAAFAQRGAAGVVCPDGDVWRVLAAGYALEADARRVTEQLAEREGVETGVLALRAAPVSLRVTARAEDVSAIVAADAAWTAQLDQVAALAMRVDRGEIGDGSARTLAALARSELESAREALGGVAGADEDAVCAMLDSLLARLAGALDGVARGSESGAALSGRLRACHADALLRRAALLDALG